jgi:hypothetical protein
MTANRLAASERLASFVAAWNAAGFRTHLFGLNQLALNTRIAIASRPKKLPLAPARTPFAMIQI